MFDTHVVASSLKAKCRLVNERLRLQRQIFFLKFLFKIEKQPDHRIRQDFKTPAFILCVSHVNNIFSSFQQFQEKYTLPTLLK